MSRCDAGTKILGVRLDEPGFEQQAHTRENQDLHEDGIICPGSCGMDKNQILGAEAKTKKKENHDVHERNDGEEHSLERGPKPEQGSNSRTHGPS
jgi:hypothetical protein